MTQIENLRIDAVIAWVDGADQQLFEKRRKYQVQHNLAVSETRFADRGEIYYCVASILKYANFVNKIWIVTDNQRPKFIDLFEQSGLCGENYIEVVDHRELFAGHEEVLPTFNTRSIEAVLWRIPSLAEHFVYFNDDYFINRPLRAEDWFADGRPVLHGSHAWSRRFSPWNLLRKILFWRPARPGFRAAQELAANTAGVHGKFLLSGHHPHPMRRSVQKDFYTAHPEILRAQIGHRFRNASQYNPIALSNHLEIARNKVEFDQAHSVAYVTASVKNPSHPAIQSIRLGEDSFGCIQSLDNFSPQMLGCVRKLMRDKFREFLPFEIEIEI